jgi:hypothetical protein
MKKLFIVAAVLISASTFAQSNKEDVDYIQAIYGKEKKSIVAEFIKLDGKAKDDFWKLYDEYEVKRKELGRRRISLLEKYTSGYSTLDDSSTDDLTKEMIDLGKKTDDLISSYYGKIKKASGVKAAAQFVQIESYLVSIVRANILENIPFIGELD